MDALLVSTLKYPHQKKIEQSQFPTENQVGGGYLAT